MLKSLALTAATALFAGQGAAQSGSGYVCPITPPNDGTALEFAYAVQKFLYNFYEANGDYMASMFSDFPNATMPGHNGMPLSADLATNFAGLEKQAQLGVEGIQQLASMAGDGYQQPSCDYSYPPGFQSGGSAMKFVMSAYFIEATLCGTFIGLADYVQSPPAAFLMARLSAEHGIHASFLGSYFMDTPYSADSMALTPAFTPAHVLQQGNGASRSQVGMLGQYIPSSCAPIPPVPCGGEVSIGMINAMLSGEGSGSGSMNGSTAGVSYGNGSSTTSGYGGMPSSGPGYAGNSTMPEQQVGSGSDKLSGSLAALCAAGLMAASMLV